MILTSPLLSSVRGIRHGFSTRLGGVSKGSFATMNLGPGLGDPAESVSANKRRLQALLGMSEESRFVEVHQVHGTVVVSIGEAASVPADGIVSREPGAGLAIRTADCAPLLMVGMNAAGSAEVVAAIHAGWRGATNGIVEEAIRVLGTYGAEPSQLSVAIGPTIGVLAFEVGDEVIEAAQTSLGRAPPRWRSPSGKWHLDLTGLLREQLLDRGVLPSRVEKVGGCTHAQPALFFSHRRDRGHTGRQLSLIALE